MKKALCSILLCLAALQAESAALPSHEQFEHDVKAALSPLAGGAVTGLKVVYLSADVGPWQDTGLEVKPGETVTVLLSGRAWLSRHYDISLEAPIQVWRRIGQDGAISRGEKETDTFVADTAGTLQLKNLPVRWLDTKGNYRGDPAAVNPDAGGGVSIALIRWAPNSNVKGELARLASGDKVPSWIKDELARLSAASIQPTGWNYLWELGPAGIFSESHGDGRDGGPARRIDAHTHNDVAILQKEVNVALTPGTALQWSWKVDQLPAKAAENIAIAHDYLSIAVEFDNGKDLTYLWSKSLPAGLSFGCPLEGWKDRETHVVARSGDADLGKWLSESRDILADYDKAIGGQRPARVLRVWLIANSVFGRGEGHAQFGDIRVGAHDTIQQVW